MAKNIKKNKKLHEEVLDFLNKTIEDNSLDLSAKDYLDCFASLYYSSILVLMIYNRTIIELQKKKGN